MYILKSFLQQLFPIWNYFVSEIQLRVGGATSIMYRPIVLPILFPKIELQDLIALFRHAKMARGVLAYLPR